MLIPEKTSILMMKAIKKRHAKEFVQKGQIKFNPPSRWISDQATQGQGRGDVYEGTCAFSYSTNYNENVILTRKYGHHNRNENGRLLFKRSRSLELPTYCLYRLLLSDFSTPNKEGKTTIKADIPAEYFKDFAEHKSYDEICKLPEEERPVLLVIKDIDEFIGRLREKLHSIGVSDLEIMMADVNYMDFEQEGQFGWMDFNADAPKELFIKSTKFRHQKEFRIVINTSNEDVISQLSQAIEIGDLSDICELADDYFANGLCIETTVIAESY